MVFVKIFAFLDLIILIIILGLHFNFVNSLIITLLAALYLFFKGIIFIGDFFSILDILVGIYLVLMYLGVQTFVTYIIIFYFIYKIVFSFIH